MNVTTEGFVMMAENGQYVREGLRESFGGRIPCYYLVEKLQDATLFTHTVDGFNKRGAAAQLGRLTPVPAFTTVEIRLGVVTTEVEESTNAV